MSDQNKLREILEALVVEEFEGVVFVDDNDYSKAEQAILEWVNEVIGEDEPETIDLVSPAKNNTSGKDTTLKYPVKYRATIIDRNELRAEQRRRAGL